MPLLEVKDLRTYFYTDDGVVRAVDGVDFQIHKRETLGIVGESGCGKSVTALSIMLLVPFPGKIIKGSIIYRSGDGDTFIDLCKLKPNDRLMRSIRGKEISMIFQEPMICLNPVYTIGDQIMEAVILHQKMNKKEARKRVIEMLAKVRFPDPRQRVNSYPHQLSGGLQQRAMIAMALSCNPSLLIADEPTTAVDVTIQAQILELMKQLQDELDIAIIFITHDMGVVSETCDKVAVMYLGQIVECASVHRILQSPKHPYTRALLRSIPILPPNKERLNSIEGDIPTPLGIGKGCRFLPRCKEVQKPCQREENPSLIEVEENHWVRCWLYGK